VNCKLRALAFSLRSKQLNHIIHEMTRLLFIKLPATTQQKRPTLRWVF